MLHYQLIFFQLFLRNAYCTLKKVGLFFPTVTRCWYGKSSVDTVRHAIKAD